MPFVTTPPGCEAAATNMPPGHMQNVMVRAAVRKVHGEFIVGRGQLAARLAVHARGR